MSNEQFGVSELAEKIGMSRSNLLRKVQKSTNLSASQFIRQVRLKKAMKLLKEKSFNVSEVSYEVGFNSTSYFIKCFHEHYGYPPGEVGKRDINESETPQVGQPKANRISVIFWVVILIIIVVAVAHFVFNPFSFKKRKSREINCCFAFQKRQQRLNQCSYH